MAVTKTNTAEEERSDEPDGPLIDSLSASVKKMVVQAKERGYVTYDELNKAMPPEQVSSEQIEDTMAMLSELGINVIESDEGEDGAQPEGKVVEKAVAPATQSEDVGTTMIRCACTCVKWGRWNCCRARARSLSPSASRPAAKR